MTSSASGTGSTGWQSSKGPKQQLTGLASGMDTQSIVTSLMSIEKQSYDKLEVKKQTEQLRLQAYQAVNSMLLKFKSSITNLSSQKLWNSKLATSSNENSLKATASQYAVNGSYSFRVTQVASQAEYTSKGFSDTKETFGKADKDGNYEKLGSITMNSPKSRVDDSAKLESLNGGKGVFRGSIRITDARGNSGTVDLSGCETVSDAVNMINNGSGFQVKASIGRKDGESFIELVDETGGSGFLKVQDVGLGTTAKDLGLNVDAVTDGTTQTLSGRNVYYLGRDSDLSMLNDGLGVEMGNEHSQLRIAMDISGSKKGYVDVDLSRAKTVGDVMDAVNSAFANYEEFADLTFGMNAARNGFEFTGAKAGTTLQVHNLWDTLTENIPASNPQIAEQLGLKGTFVADTNGTMTGERLLGDVDSPLLSNMSGATGKGIGSGNDSRVPMDLKITTPVGNLNNGNGIDIGSGLILTIHEGNGYDGRGGRLNMNILDNAKVQDVIKNNKSLGELVTAINESIADMAKAQNVKALEGVTVAFEDGALVWKGVNSAYTFEVGGTLGMQLGLDRVYGELGGSANDLPAELKDLLGSKDIRTSDMDEGFADNALVENLQAVGTTGAIKDNGGLDAILSATDPFSVTIGSDTYDLQAAVDRFKALDPSKQTVNTLMAELENELATLVKADKGPDASSPYLYYRQHNGKGNSGLVWANVDFNEDFKVSGALAEALGVDKNYTPPSVPPMPALTDDDTKALTAMTTGYLEYVEIDGTNATTLTLGDMNHGKGLSLAGDNSDTMTLTITPPNGSSNSPVTISVSKATIISSLQTYIYDKDPSQYPGGYTTVDVNKASLEDYLHTLNSVIDEEIQHKITGGELGADAKFVIKTNQAGLYIANAYGSESGETIQLGGELVMNGTWGLGNTPVVSKEKDTNFTDSQLSFLLPAIVHREGISGLGKVILDVGGTRVELETKASTTVDTDWDYGIEITDASSLREMMEYFNKQLVAQGHSDIQFVLNASGTGLALDNSSNQNVVIKNNSKADVLASDLGLLNADGSNKTYSSYSITDSLALGRRFIDRSTTLKDLAGGKTLELGTINITNTLGNTTQISLEECLTVGDVVDAINWNPNNGIKAQINATGDGIDLIEYWPGGEPADDKRIGNIKISDEGTGNVASLLGIDKTGEGYVEGLPSTQRNSVLSGSVKKTINVTGADTLESLMNRLSEQGFKTAIIDDGSGPNSKRLKVMSTSTGAANDFVLDCDLAFLGLTQTSRGKDAKVLSGDPSSGASPMMLSSPTNTNSKAIPGLTLEIKETSEKYTTITIDTDKTKVADEIKNMVQTYNDLNDFIAYLDGIDPESYEKGVLFGDTFVRSMMESIDDMFYQVYNPNGYGYDEKKNEKTSWTWMDLGISFDVNQTNQATGVTGSGWYSTMALDEEVLNEMVASNWDNLYNTLASQRNASNSKLSQRVAAQSTFSFKTIYDKDGNPIEQVRNDPNGAINNDYGSTFENGNGFVANNTIAQGENEYTIFFQGNIDASRIDIYHGSADTALSDFLIEYLDPATGKWETFRKIEGNTASSNVGLTFVPPRQIQALRITANKTNAADGKFRLLDVQVLEDTGLAGKLNKLTSSLGDVTTGWLAERNEDIEITIKDLNDQMSRQSERLEAKEASLWRQFTAMEVAMSKLQNQSSQLSGLLSSLSSS